MDAVRESCNWILYLRNHFRKLLNHFFQGIIVQFLILLKYVKGNTLKLFSIFVYYTGSVLMCSPLMCMHAFYQYSGASCRCSKIFLNNSVMSAIYILSCRIKVSKFAPTVTGQCQGSAESLSLLLFFRFSFMVRLITFDSSTVEFD